MCSKESRRRGELDSWVVSLLVLAAIASLSVVTSCASPPRGESSGSNTNRRLETDLTEADPKARRTFDSALLHTDDTHFAIPVGMVTTLDSPPGPRPNIQKPPPGEYWEFRVHWADGQAASFYTDLAGEPLLAILPSDAQLLDVLRRTLVDHFVLDILESPRRPYDEEWIAAATLAGAGDPRVFDDPMIDRLRKQLIDRLGPRSLSTGAERKIARRLIPHAAHFSSAELNKLRGSGDVVVRLLPLLGRMLAGERAAIDELLVLSLEYHGDAEYFQSALEVALPRELNESFYRETVSAGGSDNTGRAARRAEGRRVLRVLRERAERLEVVETTEGKRWRIRPASEDPSTP